MDMDIQEGGSIGPHAEEEGMAEIHLAGETGQKVPTGGQNGKDAGQNEDADQIRISG